MKARVVEAQADLFEVGVLSQTAEVQAVSVDQLIGSPAGAPVVMIGRSLAANQLSEIRRVSFALARAHTAVIVVPPFIDLDLGRYFETPVQLRVQRRAAESLARVTEAPWAEVLGNEVRVRSDHVFDTALGPGVLAVDAAGKPVLVRYQATNTAGPVFFSSLQLLTYTSLSDEEHREGLLAHLLSWTSAGGAGAAERPQQASTPQKLVTVREEAIVAAALLLAAGGPQPDDQIQSRAQALLGLDLGADEVHRAVAELRRRGLFAEDSSGPLDLTRLEGFVEQRGMHPYLRELAALLAAEEKNI